MFYDVWTKGVANFFSRVRHTTKDGKESKLSIVFANPDRAAEKIVEKVARKKAKINGLAEGEFKQLMNDSEFHQRELARASPYAAIYMEAPTYHAKFYNPGQMLYRRNTRTGAALVMPYPRPMEAMIRLDLYVTGPAAEAIATQITSQVDMLFDGPMAIVTVNWADRELYRPPFNVNTHAKYFNRTKIRLYLEDGWVNNTDLEMFDKTRRRENFNKSVRYTWTGRIEGYIPYPLTEGRIIRDIVYQFNEGVVGDSEFIEDYLAGVED